jgi:hypothetical protein
MTIRKIALAGVAVAFAALAAQPAQAGVGGLFGVTITTDGKVGFSANVLTNNRQDRWVGAAGITYYPWASATEHQNFGVTLGGGYAGTHWGVIGGWDFLQQAPVITGGYATNH